jgi:hypothetical protein
MIYQTILLQFCCSNHRPLFAYLHSRRYTVEEFGVAAKLGCTMSGVEIRSSKVGMVGIGVLAYVSPFSCSIPAPPFFDFSRPRP